MMLLDAVYHKKTTQNPKNTEASPRLKIYT